MAGMIKKVGVIGSGQMGNGIAHVAALGGYDVVLNDLSADRLKSAMATSDGLSDCDLVIETAVEKEEVKRKIFHDLCAVLKADAIIASNTSSISITRLASSTARPERFIAIS